ncbi:pentapeptide repeat-containing protein [Nonomuraea sp. NPDC000554]|uniref:pentapeptide repeat-containing protein n=1 Tax=Nonomuraea sp. NPDC000554 TaxID=3154259 RepID=UPI00332942E1
MTIAEALEIVKISLAVVAGAGGVVALVVAYRKQRVTEAGEQREQVKLYAERFDKAADKLGSESAAVRLAGIHALASLADDWEGGRQMCIDVLCAYLRMPPAPKPDADDPESLIAWQGMAEVRATATRLIGAHLRYDAPVPWHGHDFDFTAVTFDTGLDFGAAVFSGGRVSFDRAVFAGGLVRFYEATFSGGIVSFDEATFSGGEVRFLQAYFSGSFVSFKDAVFLDSTVTFDEARFAGGKVRFLRANFRGGRVSFDAATFSGGHINYHNAAFSGSTVSYASAGFFGSYCSFGGAAFTAGVITFQDARFASGAISFAGTEFPGGVIYFDRAEFSGSSVDFANAAFAGSTIRFDEAIFDVPPLLGNTRFSGGTVDLRLVRWGKQPIDLPERGPGLLLTTTTEGAAEA